MCKNIVLCESPLQILNSIDYLEFIDQLQDSYFFIRLNGNPNNDNLIREIILKNKIDHYIFTAPPNSKAFLIYSHLIFLLKLIRQKEKKLIIGDYRSKWMLNQTTLCLYKNIEITFIDDGLATIDSLKSAEKIQNKISKRIHYYTLFNLKSNVLNVIKKPCSHIKINTTNSMLFIGSPLIEKKITTKENYIYILKKIITKNEKFPEITYCLHRGEHILTNNELLSLGFTSVVRLNTNIESALESGEVSPKLITGLYSTALANIDNKFLGLSITAYKPYNAFFTEKFLATISNVYDYFQNNTSINIEKI